jgi:uncharacterized membrane protein
MIKKIWSWKWRIVALIIFVVAFVSVYPQGLLKAILNTFGVYAIYALGQLVADEIKSAEVLK